MESYNYALFEIIKYKIEFLESLEYSLLTYTPNKENIDKHLKHLKSTINKSLYKDILSRLFTSYKKINKSMIIFLNNYTSTKIIKLCLKKNLKNLLKFNEDIIDCAESFNQIISSFIQENELKEKTDKRILNLIELNSNHFNHFLFFNYLNYYLCIFHQKEQIKYTEKDLRRLISVIKYCNRNDEFSSCIEALKTENEEQISSQLKIISNKCIELEKSQHSCLSNLLNTINNELQNNKNT